MPPASCARTCRRRRCRSIRSGCGRAIELTGQIRGGERGDVRRRARELIEALDIGDWENIMGQRLSGGIKRLVGFCMVTV